MSLQQLNYTLIPFTSFFSFSSNLCNNVKIKRYKVFKKFNLKPLSLKSLRRGSGHSKEICHSAFSFHTPYPPWNLDTLHETALSSINSNQIKSLFRLYIWEDMQIMKFILYIKQESYKFKSKHQVVETNSACYNIWNSYCNFEGFFSSLVQWFNLVRLIAFDMERVSCLYFAYFFFTKP